MWVKSKWRSSLFSVLLVLASAACQGEKAKHSLPGLDLKDPEQVLAHLKRASKDDKKMADHLYAHAVRATKRLKTGGGWGTASKYSQESLNAYPTGKTFLFAVEVTLRFGAEARETQAREGHRIWLTLRESLTYIVKWFDSALAVEAYERSLDDAGRHKLRASRDCLKRYLETEQYEPDCAPLQWANIKATQKL